MEKRVREVQEALRPMVAQGTAVMLGEIPYLGAFQSVEGRAVRSDVEVMGEHLKTLELRLMGQVLQVDAVTNTILHQVPVMEVEAEVLEGKEAQGIMELVETVFMET